MKLITLINQNIPFWSVIKGDHACTDHKKILGESLIKTPDFTDPRENALRKTYLRETKGRKWLHDLLVDRSFALVELEKSDLESALTVWKRTPLMKVCKEYKAAYEERRSFSLGEVTKEETQVVEVRRRQQILPKVEGTGWLTSFEETLDYHRGIWIKRREENFLQVVDGTHRTIATVWRYLLDKGRMPKPWYAMMCVVD